MAQVAMIYSKDGLEFVWRGGAYIDIFVEGADGSAIDAYNVWDYEKDEPRIKRTLKAFSKYIETRLKEEQDELENFLAQ